MWPAAWLLVHRRSRDEENLSTEQTRAQASPRLSCAHGDGRWPEGHRRSSRPRPQETLGLIDTCAPPMGGAWCLDLNHGHRPSGLDALRSETGGAEVEPAVSTIGRLKRRADFLAAAGGGRRFHTDRMTAQGLVREGGEPSGLRIGFTVTKRVGHATERNRIKRRLRGAVSDASRDLPGIAADVVLVARRPILGAPFETLVQDLRRAVDAVTKPRPARADTPPDPRPSRAGTRTGSGKPRGAAPSRPSPDRPARAPALNASLPPNVCDGSTDG